MATNLFRFALKGDLTVWRYNDSAVSVSALSQTWTPATINFDRQRADGDDSSGVVDVEDTLEPVRQFLLYNPATALFLQIRRNDGTLLFDGEVTTFRAITSKRIIQCNLTASENLNRSLLPRDFYQPTCNAELGDARCGVNLASFRETFTESGTTFNGDEITNAAIGNRASGFFTQGFLTVGSESRFIVSHVGSTIRTLGAVTTQTGTFTANAGCPKTRAVCVSRFNNLVNFRGFDRVPVDNPTMDGIR